MEAGEEFAGVECKGSAEANQVQRGHVAPALFDAADVVAVEAGGFGECLLGESELDAPSTDSIAESQQYVVTAVSNHARSVAAADLPVYTR